MFIKDIIKTRHEPIPFLSDFRIFVIHLQREHRCLKSYSNVLKQIHSNTMY